MFASEAWKKIHISPSGSEKIFCPSSLVPQQNSNPQSFLTPPTANIKRLLPYKEI